MQNCLKLPELLHPGKHSVFILNMSLTEFPVRIVKDHAREGIVEVFYGGLWGTVGLNKWDRRDALVFCRQLGFKQVQNTYAHEPPIKQRVIWFGDFECQGSEATLGQCKHSLIARSVYTDDQPSDVFVRCGNDTEDKTGD